MATMTQTPTVTKKQIKYVHKLSALTRHNGFGTIARFKANLPEMIRRQQKQPGALSGEAEVWAAVKASLAAIGPVDDQLSLKEFEAKLTAVPCSD